jgi:hypothetical protein
MKDISHFLSKPAVLALVVLLGGLYTFHSVSTRYFERVKGDRDDLVASLRQAQTPEPEITAISRAFDRVASEAGDMAMSFFAFTSVVLVTVFAVRRSEPPREAIQQKPHGELRRDHAA